MRNLLFIISLIVSSNSLGEEAIWEVYISENGWASISDTHKGQATLSEAIASIPEELWLRHFRVFPTEANAKLQKEIDDYLLNNHPETHAQALESAGNMHNPKIVALREPFKEAILASSLVKQINGALAKRCERISATSFEKLNVRKKEGRPIYGAMVWLSTEQCT